MEYERRNPRNMVFVNMSPSSYWAENADSHCLMIDLPGFKREDVRIRADDKYENIIVSGEKQTNDNKIIHFEQSFIVPQTCNIADASGILEDDIFYITLPKRDQSTTPEQEIPRFQDSTSQVEKDETRNKGTFQEDEEKEKEVGRTDSTEERPTSSLLDKISKNLKKTQVFVLTSLLAFSLGVVASHRYHSSKQRSKDPNKG